MAASRHGWSEPNARRLARLILRDLDEGRAPAADAVRRLARAVAEGLALPELLGLTDVARELGVRTSNVRKLRGLPEPVGRSSGGTLWEAEEVREFRRRRDAERTRRDDG